MEEIRPAERIRVDAERWGFVGDTSGAAFVPFGGSLPIPSSPEHDLLGPHNDISRTRLTLDRCAALGTNVLRLFLPITSLAPHASRRNGSVDWDKSRVERLERVLLLSQESGIRLVIAFTLKHAGSLSWWRQGDTVFGKPLFRSDDAPCALTMHTQIVSEVVQRLRNHPAIFAWSVAAEWMLPDPSWGPSATDDGWGTTAARFYWMQYALARYNGQLDRLNRAWGTSYHSPPDITLPTISWHPAAKRYATSPVMVSDYQLFREWASLRFLRPQISAIRRASPGHLVTCGMPMRQWNLAAGEAALFTGLSTPSISPWVDYVTVHFHGGAAAVSSASQAHQLEIACRFAWSGERRPVVIEEMDAHGSTDRERAQRLHEWIRATIGHASGWMTTQVQHSTPPSASDTTDRGAWIDEAMRPTFWGQTARSIRTEVETANRTRKPPRRTITLDRQRELAPVMPSTLLSEADQYARRPQPVDFRVEPDPALQVTLTGDEIILREAAP